VVSELLHHIVWWLDTDILEDCDASVKEGSEGDRFCMERHVKLEGTERTLHQ
jgi:hypothetical protein